MLKAIALWEAHRKAENKLDADRIKAVYLLANGYATNAGYYRSKLIQSYLETSKIKLMFLPPYSPNLNLIERLWKFMKKTVLYNKYYEKFSLFENAIIDFFENLYEDKLRSLLTQNFQIINSSQILQKKTENLLVMGKTRYWCFVMFLQNIKYTDEIY